MEQWVEEFLFRGRPPSGPGREDPPTWHVVIGQQLPNAFDPNEPPQRRLLGPLTPEQAKTAFGIDLPKAIEEINTAAVERVAELESEKAQLLHEADELREQIEEAKKVAQDAITYAARLLEPQLAAAVAETGEKEP